MSAPSGSTTIRVKTNTFEITKLPKHRYRQFDAFVTPNKVPQPKADKKQLLFHHLQNVVAPDVFHPRMIYDGQKIAYAPVTLTFAPQSFLVNLAIRTVADAEVRGTVRIVISPTASELVDPNDVKDLTVARRSTTKAAVATNLLQIIVRQAGNRERSHNNRAYFVSNNARAIQGSGLELWNGIFQSVRPTLGRMVLNIDTTVGVFYQRGEFIDYVLSFLRFRDVRQLENIQKSDPDLKRLEGMVKGLLVTVKVNSTTRKKKISGLQLAAGKYRFEDSGGRERTVEDYYFETYGLRLRYSRILGIRVGKKDGEYTEIFPAELCSIAPGQFFKRKLPDNVISELVSFSAIKPGARLKTIQDTAREHQRSEDLAEAGLKIGIEPIVVNGLILSPPSVRYGDQRGKKQIVNPRGGQWNLLDEHRKPQRFLKPHSIHLWAIVNFARASFGPEKTRNLAHCLRETCRNLGMDISEDAHIELGNEFNVEVDLGNARNALVRRAQQLHPGRTVEAIVQKLNFVFIVVLPQHAGEIRRKVKRWGDTHDGFPTNCLREDKMKQLRANDQYLSNVALKLNPRVYGENSAAISSILEGFLNAGKRAIVMGADVGHPGPGIQRPSVTSVVYTHSVFSTQYSAIMKIQEPRLEVISDLYDFVGEAVSESLINSENTHTDLKTGKQELMGVDGVFFYRDGLSEGEFATVAPQEIKEIQRGIKAAYDLYKKQGVLAKDKQPPKLVYIIVGKRHHITLYPEHSEAGDRKGNCHPGTVVQSGITHPTQQDFYLQSHSAIQGTARSSHYTVILDEIWEMQDMNAIQNLSYALCYSYVKATRAVSIPAPVYYADSVCTRLNFHLDDEAYERFGRDDVTVTSGSSAPPFDLAEWQRHFRPIHPNMKHRMYFL